MAILVTGGAGYIGSHTCVELLNAGKDIIILDNYSNSKPEAVKRIGQLTGKAPLMIEGDMLDRKLVRSIFTDYDIEAVIHFAGLKAVGESVTIPLSYYHNNITGTLILCEEMAAAGCKKIVFSSSATVYGTSTNVPFTEDLPVSATNPYGWTKVMIEQILRDVYVSDDEWSISLLRYFNPIGAHPSGLLGEDPEGIPNNLFPYIGQVAAGKLPYLQVFGDDYDTPDGTGVRDYLHVVDLAKGHLDALEYVLRTTGTQDINLGTGIGYSVLDALHAYEKACGKDIPHKIMPRRPGDIATCYADASKAESLLGWKAQHTMDDMCRDGWNFIKQNPNGL